MFAVIETGGKQYKVSEKDEIVIEKMTADIGAQITFDKVHMLGEGAKVSTGKKIGKAKVKATVMAHERQDKIIVFKKKRRKGYKRTKGHRQHHTVVRIDKINKG